LLRFAPESTGGVLHLASELKRAFVANYLVSGLRSTFARTWFTGGSAPAFGTRFGLDTRCASCVGGGASVLWLGAILLLCGGARFYIAPRGRSACASWLLRKRHTAGEKARRPHRRQIPTHVHF